MKTYYDLVVVIPVGPGTNPEFAADTINSFMYYAGSSYKIIIADDSHERTGEHLKKQFPAIDILYTKTSMGHMAGLYITLSLAYSHAIKNYEFALLLKLDTDALVIGSQPEAGPMQLLLSDSTVGIAGQYPLDYHGNLWDRGWPRARIINGTMTWKFIKRPVANIVLRKYYLKALRNDYITGESVFGGAYFMSKKFVASLHHHHLLPNKELRKLNLGEDHLFGLLAKALGFGLADMSSGTLPFACAWKGLPASPLQLFSEGKKIIHSTRSWQDMKEEDIRAWFREKRKQPVHNNPMVSTNSNNAIVSLN